MKMIVRGVLKSKDFQSVDMVFSNEASFLDRDLKCVQNAPVTFVHTSYSDTQRR